MDREIEGKMDIHKSKILKLPFFGRIAIVRDKDGSADSFPGGLAFRTNLSATLIHKGKIQGTRNLGSGLVTNVGALALANEAVTLASPSGARVNCLFLANQHISGTGVAAAAASDIKIQTISTNGGQTAVAGTQTLVSAANSQRYRTVATIAYTGAEAVTEWALLTDSVVSVATGSPFTAGTATTGTTTGAALTASSATAQGHQQHIFENTASATPHWGLAITNTTSVVTVPAWYKVSDGTAAGTTPQNGEAYLIRPVLWDHKVFSAINVADGDSIQFTYSLTISSGG